MSDRPLETEPELPSVRAWKAQLAEVESERGPQWTEEFSPRARRLIALEFEECFRHNNDDIIDRSVHATIEHVMEQSEHQPLMAPNWHMAREAGAAEYADWLQAASITLTRHAASNGNMLYDDDRWGSYEQDFRPDAFRARVNEILLARRVSFTFRGEALIPRAEEPLHADIVVPVTARLAADPVFARAEAAFGAALSHLDSAAYGASVTDAATAVQEALRAVDCEGETLGDQLKKARTTKLIEGHDEKLGVAIKALGDWLTADRSRRGNAHYASSAKRADAQLSVHIAGAFILRLVAAKRSSEGGADDLPL